MKRWLVVLGALIIQMNLGAVYAWSLFNKPLMEKFGWERGDVVFTFSITIAVFALSTIAAGKLQDRVGPRYVATLGGLLLGAGLMLASQADTLTELYIYYGVIGGMGIGAAYVTPLSACLKWFPDKRGLIGGLAVAGFGAGGLVYKPIITSVIEYAGVSMAFFYLGVLYLILVVAGAQLLLNPPTVEEAVDSSRKSPPVGDPAGAGLSFGPMEMLRTASFYGLWVMFFFGSVAGLMVISFAIDIGVELAGLSVEQAGTAVMIIALFNASGRIVWGKISDSIGRKNALILMYGLTVVTLIYMSFGTLNFALYMASVSLIGFCFGGFLAIFPSITADYYGTKSLGMNYGIVYQAYGISAFAGPFIVKSITFTQAFLAAAVCCLIAMALAKVIEAPRRKQETHSYRHEVVKG